MFEAGKIERGLRWMGDAPSIRAIIARLHRREIKGIRGSLAYCPLALFLARWAGLEGTLSVHPSQVSWGDQTWPVPPQLRVFIRRFDEGRYPSLEA